MKVRASEWVDVLCVAVLYASTAFLGLAIDRVGGYATVIWPPAGIAVAAIILRGPRMALGVVVGAAGINGWLGAPLPAAIGIGIGSAAGPLVAATALRRLSFHPRLDRPRDVFALSGGAIVSAIVSATAGTTALLASGRIGAHIATKVWAVWWFGDMSGIVLATPVLLTWYLRAEIADSWRDSSMVERVALGVVIVAAPLFLFTQGSQWAPAFARPYLLIPLLLWGALRFGPLGAATTNFALSVVVSAATVFGHGPFYRASWHESFILLLTFLIFAGMSSLVTGAITGGRARDHAALRRAQALNRATLDAAHDAMVTVDRNGTIRDFNRSAEELFMFRRDEVIGTNLVESLVPPLHRSLYRTVFARSPQGAKLRAGKRRMKLPALRSNGEQFVAEISLARVTFEGSPLYTAFVRDVTQIEEAQRIIRDANERLEERVEERTSQLRRVNAKLRKRDAQLLEAQALAHIGDFEWHLQSDTVSWSPELRRLLGVPPKERASTEAFFERLMPEQRAEVRATIKKMLCDHEPIEYEALIIRPDGTVRVLHSRGRVECDAAGKPAVLRGTCQDVTERRRMEHAREHLARIVDWSAEAIISKKLDGTIQSWNRGAEAMYGYRAEEVLNRPIDVIVPADQREDALKWRNQVVEDGLSVEFETVRRRRNGDTFDVAITMSPIRDEAGRVRGISSITRDVSAHKKAEARMKTLLDGIPDGMVILDRSGKIVASNLRTVDLFGYTQAELVGQPVETLVPPRLRARHALHRAGYFADAKIRPMGANLELSGLRKDGTEFPVEISLAPIQMENELLVFAAVRDVTEKRWAEKQMRASLREKEVLLREIHHRVKNNLQVIASLLNLQAGSVASDDMRRAVEESESRIQSMALVHELLYQSTDLRSIDFGVYLSKLASRISHGHGLPPGRIAVKLPEPAVDVDIDTAIPCALIVNELVANALKHAFPDGRPGTIRVGVEPTAEGGFTLIVRDDGVGLPIDARPDRRKLGLQIVQTLTRQLRGKLTMDRDGGTTARIVVPPTSDRKSPTTAPRHDSARLS